MKTYLNKAIAFAILLTSFYNCTIESIDNLQDQSIDIINIEDSQANTCTGISPKARMTNNGTIPFDFEIYDSSGSLIIGFYNVLPSTQTDWYSFDEDNTIFVVENDSVEDQKVSHQMDNCTEINLEIDSNNLLTNAQPQQASN